MQQRKIAVLGIVFATILSAPVKAGAISASRSETRVSESDLEHHPSLEAIQQYAFEHNPAIRAASEAWRASEQDIAIDSSYANPKVTYMPDTGNMVETRAGGQTNGFGLSQTIPFPGKLTLKGKIASQTAKAAQEAVRTVSQEIARRVRVRFADYYLAQRSLEVNAQTMILVRQFESIAQAKYRVGKVSEQDVIQGQEQLSRLATQRIDFEKQREVALGSLNALLDRPTRAKIGSPSEMKVSLPSVSLASLVRDAVAARPEIKAENHLVQARRDSVKLARMGYLPDFSIGGQYVGIDNHGVPGFTKDGHDVWTATIGVSVPIWMNRVKAGVDRAGAQLLQQKFARRSLKDIVTDQVQAAYERLTAAARNERIYRTTLLPQTGQRIAAARAGYQTGIVDFLTLIDSLKSYENVRLLRYKAVRAYEVAGADLARAIGRPVPGVVK